jgi:hypothetical protein
MPGLELGDIQEGAALLIALVVVAAFLVFMAGRRGRRRNRSRWTPYRLSRVGRLQRHDRADARQQLDSVRLAPFEKQRLLSRIEYRAFRIIEEDVAAGRRGHRVFAQTSLGEVLKTPSPNAFSAINSKRVDILIVDPGGWPLLAVEFQGNGHYQGDAVMRDAVKREALRKAGVRYLEVFETDSDIQIRSRVREQLGWSEDAPAKW